MGPSRDAAANPPQRAAKPPYHRVWAADILSKDPTGNVNMVPKPMAESRLLFVSAWT
jgi:hypothetical protein